MMRRAYIGALAFGLVLGLGGCGLKDPREERSAKQQASPTPSLTPSAVQEEGASPAASPRPVPSPPAGGGASSAAEVAKRYAEAYSNWTWRDVAVKNGSMLARLTAGKLRSVIVKNIPELKEDTTFERDRATNRGDLLAVDEQGSGPRKRTVWLVLRETSSTGGTTSPQGRRITVYRVTTERSGKRWFVTGFQPER